MNKVILTLLLLLPLSNSYSAFSYENACFTTNTNGGGGLIKHKVETCMTFSKNSEGSLTAERVTEESLNRVKRYFNLTKDGVIYHVNLDTNQCKWTNIEVLTDHINDPEKLAQEIQQGMDFKPAGPCKDKSGDYQGDLFTHAFGKICLLDGVFTLWHESPGATTTVTDIRFNIRLPKDKITLPVDVNTCVEGPDLTKGIGGLMNYGQSDSVSEQGNSQSNTSGSSTNQQQPSQEEMEKMQKQANEMMKNLGKSLEGLFPKQE